VEASATAAYACDREGHVLAYNADAVALWGTEPQGNEEERYCGPVRLVMADGITAAPEYDWLVDAVRTHKARAHGEARLVRTDGSILAAEVYLRGMDSAPGEPLWSGIALVDVTQRTRAGALHLEHARLMENIATGAPLLECLENVAFALARLVPGALAGIILANESRTQLTLVSSSSLPASFVAALNSLRGEALFAACGLDRLSRAPWSYGDLASPNVAPTPWRDVWLAHGLRATLTVPIILTDGPAIAACFLAFGAPHEFDPCERQLAATGAHIASTAIARDQLQRSMREVQLQLEDRLAQSLRLHHESLKLTAACAEDAWPARIAAAAVELSGAGGASLHLMEDDTGHMALAASEGNVWGDLHAEAEGEDIGQQENEDAGPARRRATHAFALKDERGTNIGRLAIYWTEPHLLSDFERQLLTVLVRHASNVASRCRSEASIRSSQRSKDQFLAQLAHELRNPLAPIRNATQLLRRRESEWPEVGWCRDVIERQVHHLTRLVDDLLDVSRIGRNRLTLRRARVCLDDVLRAAIETTRSQLEHKRQRLGVTVLSTQAWLDADSVRLTQVFINLLTNASKYTEAEGQILLETQLTESYAEVRVIDTGVGLSTTALSRIFDLFYQVDRTLERSQGGLGIGLSLVKRLVELHGGSVSASSAGPGRGSCFSVRLPLADEAPVGAGQAEALEPVTDRESRRILVVDDNAEISDSLARLLRDLGHDVWTAPDGAQGVALAQKLQPDVVLLDLSMPGMDGYEACRRIRASDWGKSLLLVAVTARDQEEDRLRSVDFGFDFHLTKPADPDQIARMIKALSA
jgi:signal transduction histidine kinase/CheY-like chemotaxis protein